MLETLNKHFIISIRFPRTHPTISIGSMWFRNCKLIVVWYFFQLLSLTQVQPRMLAHTHSHARLKRGHVKNAMSWVGKCIRNTFTKHIIIKILSFLLIFFFILCCYTHSYTRCQTKIVSLLVLSLFIAAINEYECE